MSSRIPRLGHPGPILIRLTALTGNVAVSPRVPCPKEMRFIISHRPPAPNPPAMPCAASSPTASSRYHAFHMTNAATRTATAATRRTACSPTHSRYATAGSRGPVMAPFRPPPLSGNGCRTGRSPGRNTLPSLFPDWSSPAFFLPPPWRVLFPDIVYVHLNPASIQALGVVQAGVVFGPGVFAVVAPPRLAVVPGSAGDHPRGLSHVAQADQLVA